VTGGFEPLAEQNIRVAAAMVAAHILPGPVGAIAVGEAFRALATDPQATWEAVHTAS